MAASCQPMTIHYKQNHWWTVFLGRMEPSTPYIVISYNKYRKTVPEHEYYVRPCKRLERGEGLLRISSWTLFISSGSDKNRTVDSESSFTLIPTLLPKGTSFCLIVQRVWTIYNRHSNWGRMMIYICTSYGAICVSGDLYYFFVHTSTIAKVIVHLLRLYLLNYLMFSC